jgi:hypothetical protein
MTSVTIKGKTYGPKDAVPYIESGLLPYNRTSAQAGFPQPTPKSWTVPYIPHDQREKEFCDKACDCLGTVMDKGCEVCCGNPGTPSIFGKLSNALYAPSQSHTEHMEAPSAPHSMSHYSGRARSASPFKQKQDGGKKKSRKSRSMKTRKTRKTRKSRKTRKTRRNPIHK